MSKISGPKTKKGLSTFFSLAASLTAALLLAGCGHDGSNGTTELAAIKPRRGDLVLALTEKGRVEAKATTMVFAPVQGEIVWLAEEGARVKAGDTVARFANEEIEDQYEDAKAAFEEASRKLARAGREAEIRKRESELAIEESQSKFALAKWELDELLSESNERLIRSYETSAEIALQRMRGAKLQVESVSVLAGQDIAGREQLRQAAVAHKRAKIQYERAKKLLDSARSGPNKRRVEVAERRVLWAERSLKYLELRAVEQKKITERNIDSLRASRDSYRDKMQTLKEQIDLFNVPSPADGYVVFADVYKGGSGEMSKIRVGESRWRTAELFEIADLSTLMVRVPVSEMDVSKVQVGQHADIRLLAYPEKRYQGSVEHISPFAEDKNTKLGPLAVRRRGYAGVRVSDLRISILDADDNVRLGYAAEVSIRVGEVADRLIVPHTAVRHDDGQAFCSVVSNGRPERREVRLGQSNETEVAVLDGLKEGEKIVENVFVQ